MSFSEILGAIGALLLAFCALPQVIQCFRQKHARGVSTAFISLWGIGEILMLVYILDKPDLDLILIGNYVLNLAFIGIIAYYKI